MPVTRVRFRVVYALALSLLLVGCGWPTQQAGWQTSPLEPDCPVSPSPVPITLPAPSATPLLAPTDLPAPSETLLPALTPWPVPSATPVPALFRALPPTPGQWIVLHTNDNWGETEPCG